MRLERGSEKGGGIGRPGRQQALYAEGGGGKAPEGGEKTVGGGSMALRGGGEEVMGALSGV